MLCPTFTAALYAGTTALATALTISNISDATLPEVP